MFSLQNRIRGSREPAFHFFDVTTSERWCVKPNLGRFPWWIFSNKHRVPGSNAIDYLKAIKLAKATPDTLVTDVFDPHDSLFERYWEPLAVSVLNTPANEGAAQFVFIKGNEKPEVTYAKRKGKYMKQKGVTLPKV